MLPVQKGRPPRSATAVVEFALIAPFFALLLLGMFELSRALLVKEILSNAARKAARTAILPGAGWNDVAAASAGSELYNIMVTDNGFQWNNVTPTIVVTDPSGNVTTLTTGDPNNVLQNATWGSTISVKVAIPASATTWGPGALFVRTTMIESEFVVMMRQGNY
jgi:Flp pilus assembly protein TadG